MKKKYDAVIIGAGLAGSVSARMLADAGWKVLVVEKMRHVAGHCHDYRNDAGITVHTYGPHIFHTTDKAAWEFVNRFTEFHTFQHRVLSYAGGRLIPFPINRDTINEVFGVNISTQEVASFLSAEVKNSTFKNPPANFRDAVVSQVGERFYNLFFKNYTLKQWERDPETLSAEIAKRIPVRNDRDDRYFTDKYQGIPLNGYTRMVENMLDHPNIAVLFGEDYFDFKAALGKSLAPKLTVFTGELDRWFDYKYGNLVYRSLRLEFKTLDQEHFQPAPVVNYPNDYDWTRISEFKQFTGEKSPKTTILYEYPQETGRPYYVVLDAPNIAKRDQYMQDVSRLEAEGGILFLGRLAEYKYYDMDKIISAAMGKIRNYLG